MKKGSLVRASGYDVGIGIVKKVKKLKGQNNYWIVWLNGHMAELGRNAAMGPFPESFLEEVTQ